MTDIHPEKNNRCPRCGNGGLPIMDFEGTLPMLDAIAGFQQYYCETCSKPYTARTLQLNITPTQEEIAERRDRLARIECVRMQRLAVYMANRGDSGLMQAYISADVMQRNDTLWFECHGISPVEDVHHG